MMIFNELRKHGRLAAKRHPMYEKNKVAKIFGYVMGAFWAGYLIFFGTTFAFGFSDMVPNREPYHVMNGVVLIFILALDFLLRVPFQKTPTQEVKPYLLLPVKRNRVIDFLLIRSGLSLFNLFWLFLFVPFSFITITKFFGTIGVITYLIGILLLIIANNYWYLLCRTLISERIWWILLPIVFYGGTGCLLLIPQDSPLFYFFMDLGDGYIQGDILYFLGTILVIILLWLINRKIMSGLIYAELSKVDDTRIKHVSEYKFFERYGEVGEYMRLELKMLLRNRRCKGSLRSITIVVIAFSTLLSFSSVYDGNVMTSFICVYNFDLSIDVVRTPRFILTRIWLLVMTFMVYSILLEAFDIIRQQTVLKERAAQQETLLAIQRTQYQQLSRHMETVRQARHDLRQHLNVIDHYLSSGKTEDLKSYIEQYRMTLPPDTGRTWCENYAVNTIVRYYG